MSFRQRMTELLDYELAKKTFLALCVPVVLTVPVDALTILMSGTQEVIPAENVFLDDPKTVFQDRGAYLNTISGSTLYGAVLSGGSVPGLQASLSEMTKDYRLKGVVISSEPEAILEDAKTRKSIFVTVGGQLGDLTVKDIQEGFIVLTYLGEETKLEIR